MSILREQTRRGYQFINIERLFNCGSKKKKKRVFQKFSFNLAVGLAVQSTPENGPRQFQLAR